MHAFYLFLALSLALLPSAEAQPRPADAPPLPLRSPETNSNDLGPNFISLGISATHVAGVYARIHPLHSEGPLLSGLSLGVRAGTDFGEFRSLDGYGADIGYGVISSRWHYLRGGVMAHAHLDRWKIYVESPLDDEFTGSGIGVGGSLRLFGQYGPIELSIPIEIGRLPSAERYVTTGLMLGFGFVSTPRPGAID